MAKNTRVRVTLDQGALDRLSTRKMIQGLKAAGVVGEAAVKVELSKPGTGKTYSRGGKTHVASSPGSSPAVDGGDLRRSIGHEVSATGRTGVVSIFANKEYALALEEGKGKLRGPRPFISLLGTKHLSRLVSAFKRGARQ